MKPLNYYREISVSIPKQDDYMTIYYYRKGVMVGIKRQFDDDFQPPKNCVEEKVLDEVSYNAHLKHYYEEQERLKNEFRQDLITEYNISNHPKANKIFNKAWELGYSNGYEEVEYFFQDLVELFRDDPKEHFSYKN
jgi:flagellar biosynthesis/type III secretory pathway protein FliH